MSEFFEINQSEDDHGSFMGVQIKPVPDWPFSGSDTPTAQDALIIVGATDQRAFEVVWGRWGLVPAWQNCEMKVWTTTNSWTYLNTIDHPRYGKWGQKHCIIPVAGFSIRTSDRRKVFSIRRKDGQRMAIAGVWDHLVHDGAPLKSFTLLKRPAGPDILPIQDWEPVFLPEDQWWSWLVHQGAANIDPVGIANTLNVVQVCIKSENWRGGMMPRHGL
ncbi:SOS response-associated peptidase family protein [Asticcacaulis sp. AND118]|uniref:SOS response-associated peptidase family protein n=1 Tax=Asticcacaulis sp. AND118 TaxID=2840468 RepID=UPI001CFFF635|nr:SOS response-associated peptidase family protein [Asticcacaulis sp. AND118]UDF05576.1 SOS response-associated peptidase family protein [Asticcacaulis sp. AND118]